MRTWRIRGIAIAILAARACLAQGLAADFGVDAPVQAPQAGDLANLSRVTFTGNKTFAEDTLRRALRFDLEAAVAIRPDASLDDCLKLLDRRVRTGYRHAGFPEADVLAEADAASGHIVVHITEGPRFYCRSIEVTGLQGTAADRARERILALVSTNAPTTRESSPLESVGGTNSSVEQQTNAPSTPLWEANSPAPMDSLTQSLLAEAVTNAFADLGLYEARFSVRLKRQAAAFPDSPPGVDGHWADLVVEVRDEGTACTIGEIAVSKLRKNPEPKFLRWLGLAPGMPLTRQLLIEKHRQLVESGRFTVVELEPGTPDDDGRIKLQITVRELENAPLLSAKLPAVEETMLRMGRWFRDWQGRKDEAVLRFVARNSDGTERDFAEFIASPKSGVLFGWSSASNAATAPDLVFYARSNNVAMIDRARRQGLLSTNSKGSVTVNAQVNVDPDGKGSFTFAAGYQTSNSAPSLNVQIDSMPAALIDLAHYPGIKWREKRGELTGSSSNFEFQVEAKTGRLIKFKYQFNEPKDADIKTAFGFSGVVREFVCEFKTNALEQALSEAKAATGGFTNMLDEGHPVSSSLGFLATEALRSPFMRMLAQSNATAGAIIAAGPTLEKLFDRDLFSAWDVVLGASNDDQGGESFDIPADENSEYAGNSPLQALGVIALDFAGKIAAPGSWVGIVMRENILGVTGPADERGKGWEHLYASLETGPLACLVAARNLNSTPAARAFAIEGLMRLTPVRFRYDCRPLLEGDEVLPVTTRKFLMRLASLNDSEIDSLAAMLSGADANALRETVHALRQPDATPSMAVLGPVIDECWESSLLTRFSTLLHNALPGQP